MSMSITHYASFQFSYGPEDRRSSQLSPRQQHVTPNPKEFLKSGVLPTLRANASTPAMPDPARKTHRNHLQSHYDLSRGLQSILRLRQTVFHLNVIECEYETCMSDSL